eukprot:GFYU01027332.1.p2 GENE.GFYU01027332.1~~GFYU01027332.1.p2  ORF type:complete len:103 (+),score=35.38 GFYU01027332.1:140-448(+)
MGCCSSKRKPTPPGSPYTVKDTDPLSPPRQEKRKVSRFQKLKARLKVKKKNLRLPGMPKKKKAEFQGDAETEAKIEAIAAKAAPGTKEEHKLAFSPAATLKE